MTNEQKAAVEWLEVVEIGNARAFGKTDARTINARTILAMVSGPTLPEDGDAIDDLAHTLWMGNFGRDLSRNAIATLLRDLVKILAKPKTKTVYQVRWCTPEGGEAETTFDGSKESALSFALARLKCGCQGVGVVTDEVPA